jgi:hypothetical protein
LTFLLGLCLMTLVEYIVQDNVLYFLEQLDLLLKSNHAGSLGLKDCKTVVELFLKCLMYLSSNSILKFFIGNSLQE